MDKPGFSIIRRPDGKYRLRERSKGRVSFAQPGPVEIDHGDYATKADAIAAMGRIINPEVTYYNEKGEEIV